MNRHLDNYPSSPEPLPANFDQELAEIDSLLARQAASRRTPPGLASRVYAASVQSLPAQRPLVFSPSVMGEPVRKKAMISRLAMAASVGLAVLVGVVFLRSPGAIDVGNGYAIQVDSDMSSVAVPVELARSTSRSLSAEQEWVLLDSMRLAHFSEVHRTSLSDVTSDIAQLVMYIDM